MTKTNGKMKIVPGTKVIETKTAPKESNLEELERLTADCVEDGDLFNLKMVAGYVLIEPYLVNPFRRKVSASGLAIPDAPTEFNSDRGEYQLQNQRIKVGLIKVVGPDCKETTVGDLVYFDDACTTPIHFMGEDYYRTHETQLVAVVSPKK